MNENIEFVNDLDGIVGGRIMRRSVVGRITKSTQKLVELWIAKIVRA